MHVRRRAPALTSGLNGFQQLAQLSQPFVSRLRVAQSQLLEHKAVQCAVDQVSQVPVNDPGRAQRAVYRVAVSLVDKLDIVLELGTATRLQDELELERLDVRIAADRLTQVTG